MPSLISSAPSLQHMNGWWSNNDEINFANIQNWGHTVWDNKQNIKKKHIYKQLTWLLSFTNNKSPQLICQCHLVTHHTSTPTAPTSLLNVTKIFLPHSPPLSCRVGCCWGWWGDNFLCLVTLLTEIKKESETLKSCVHHFQLRVGDGMPPWNGRRSVQHFVTIR